MAMHLGMRSSLSAPAAIRSLRQPSKLSKVSLVANIYSEGALVRESQAFTSLATGLPADPAVVTMAWEVVPNGIGSPGSTTTWTYGGAGSIVKDGVGLYHADLDTTAKTGQWQGSWVCPPGSGQTVGPFLWVVLPRPPAH